MISFSSIMQNIVSGLNMSAVLLVAALGLVIIFGLMGVINMAHGELIMTGAYVTFFVTSVLHLPFVFAIIYFMCSVFINLTSLLLINSKFGIKILQLEFVSKFGYKCSIKNCMSYVLCCIIL